jgi:hypothetical protein
VQLIIVPVIKPMIALSILKQQYVTTIVPTAMLIAVPHNKNSVILFSSFL